MTKELIAEAEEAAKGSLRWRKLAPPMKYPHYETLIGEIERQGRFITRLSAALAGGGGGNGSEPTTEFATFHNRLRKLLNIDMYELIRAGVIEADDTAAWERFSESPWRWFIRADDDKARKLWAIMEAPR